MADGDFSRLKGLFRKETEDTRGDRASTASEYTELFDSKDADTRKGNYTSVVNKYYDIATDFYEIGWGRSFHFAPRHKWESKEASIQRHELWLAHRMELKDDMKVLDIGCGIGGPLRNIARFANVEVVGLNNNEYQISRARRLAKESNLQKVSFLKGDFMKMPIPDNSFDAAYAIEAICHAPDHVGVYSEILRILKPGGHFGSMEWVMTDIYDATNPAHKREKEGIERGNGLPELQKIEVILDALEKAGFEVIEHFDLVPHSDVAWYQPLTPRLTPLGFPHTRLGRYLGLQALRLAEWCKIAPVGSAHALEMLQKGSNSLIESGKMLTFTPMYWVHVRKPLVSVPKKSNK
eukprot:TRINITY_DN437_c0_g1_i1.p1 TRINITY_DN437_c0_g1~~TRINITY_DN437_c0_g1_i1.p1  ORF type:complete len:350 (+),score=104.34 TRINITY_DN437_c0_g1_i1:68-1117(+)